MFSIQNEVPMVLDLPTTLQILATPLLLGKDDLSKNRLLLKVEVLFDVTAN